MRARPGVAALLATIALLARPALPDELRDDDDIPLIDLELHAAVWEAGWLGRHVGGRLLWLTGPDGALRAEVSLADATPTAGGDPRRWPAWRQDGQGWTVVLGADDTGTVNAWGREWRPAPALATLLRAVVGALDNPAGRHGARKLVVPATALATDGTAPPTFRQALVRRGRGRGAAGEVVTLGPRADGGLALRSSRRPGSLRLGPAAGRPVRAPVPETFVPLWPLADLLELSGAARELPGRAGVVPGS